MPTWRLLPLLFLSGAGALVLEIAWLRRMAQIAGATAVALAGVLAAVIGGMALGAHLLGRVADRGRRPALLYAGLEAGVAVFAVLSPLLLAAAAPLVVGIHRAAAGHDVLVLTGSFLVTVLVLAPPTILMGGTLPAAAAAVRTSAGRRGRDLGRLYAVNTLGGVAGTLLSAFVLLPSLGLATTMRAAAVLSGTAAFGAWVLGRRAVVVPPAPPALPSVEGRAVRRAVHLAALSGFLGLAAEVVFTRALVLVLGATTYAFAAVLAVFLLGIVLGSFLGARLAGEKAPRRLELSVCLTAALFSLAALFVFELPRLYLEGYVLLGRTFEAAVALRFAIAAFVLLPGAIGLGVSFPLALHVATAAGKGRGTGRLLAANALASVVGSTLAVFLLVPALGPSVAMAAVATAVAGAVAIGARRPGVALLALVATVGFVPPSGPALERLLAGVWFEPDEWIRDGEVVDEWWDEGYDVPFYAWGREATVAVTRWYGAPGLRVDGKVVASSMISADVHHLALLGHVPMAVHEDPQSVLVVGLGMGTTYRAVETHAPRSVRVVEIEEAVPRAAAYLGVVPRGLVLDDARTWLRATDERYDVITADPIHPFVRGSGDLYAKEAYEACRDRLAPGGVLCQWVPLYQLGKNDLIDIVRTFTSVFRADLYYGGADLLLIGTVGRDPPPPRALTGKAQADLERVGAPDLAMLRVAGPDALEAAARDGVVLTEDGLRLEYATPRQMENDEMGACVRWVAALWGEPPPPFDAVIRAEEALAEDRPVDTDALDRAVALHPAIGFCRRFAGDVYLGLAVRYAAAGRPGAADSALGRAKRRLEGDVRLLGVEADVADAAGDDEREAAALARLLDAVPDSRYVARRLRALEANMARGALRAPGGARGGS